MRGSASRVPGVFNQWASRWERDAIRLSAAGQPVGTAAGRESSHRLAPDLGSLRRHGARGEDGTGLRGPAGEPMGGVHQELYDIHLGGPILPAEPRPQRVIVRAVPERVYTRCRKC